jgi:hypothetical protein
MDERRERKRRRADGGDDQRETEHAEIERDRAGSRQAVGKRDQQRPHAKRADQESERRARRRENDAFRDERRDQLARPRANGGANREFLVARLGSGKQQVGDVGAGDQQDEHHRALKHEHGDLRAADDLLLKRIKAQTVPLGIRRVWTVTARGRPRDRRRPRRQQRLQFGFCRGDRDAVLHAPDQEQVVVTSILAIRRINAERDEEFRSGVGHVEAVWHHADHLAADAVHLDGLPHEIRIGAVGRSP